MSPKRANTTNDSLGWLDETEVTTVPNVQPVNVDMATGEILNGEAHNVVIRPTNAPELEDFALRNETGAYWPMDAKVNWPMALTIKDKDGHYYVDIENEVLSNMTIGINKALAKDGITQEQRDEYQLKLDTIIIILQARNHQ